MPHWLKIFLFFLVIAIVTEPITSAVKKRVNNKWVAWLLDFIICFAIMFLLSLLLDPFDRSATN